MESPLMVLAMLLVTPESPVLSALDFGIRTCFVQQCGLTIILHDDPEKLLLVADLYKRTSMQRQQFQMTMI